MAMARQQPMAQQQPGVYRWIKTECGRAKYAELAARPGAWARLRLVWFVLIAALRDWPLPDPDQSGPTGA
ncbi:MAG: hypothetical protein RLZZ468_762 [Cyanobacteriota bacterium]